jgi:hypothetical protein
MSVLDRLNVPELRPLIIYGFLIGSIAYSLYQSAPQLGMKKVQGRVSTQTCIGNYPPYGCRLEVEFVEADGVVKQKTFTGSFPKKFDTFEEISVWVDPKDSNNSTVQNGWSSEGLILSAILLLVLFLYHTLRK